MFLHPDSDAPAVIDADTGRVLSHRQLAAAAADFATQYEQPHELVFLFADTSVQTLVAYVAALQHRSPVALLDASMRPAGAQELVRRYRPTVVVDATAEIGPQLAGYHLASPGVWRHERAAHPTHPALAVLLTTSGSTGSPKFVRLSRANLEANTSAIIESLGIDAADRAIATLPLHYSFGMSIVNTHLAAGGSVIRTGTTMLEPDFWDVVRRDRPTSLSGVPYTFHILRRLGLDKLDVPSIRTMTQAGGRLETTIVKEFHAEMQRRGGAFHVMYGQTEAGPRMTCLPSSSLPEKLGSAGLPLRGGTIEICDELGEAVPVGASGDVVYSGPNVMMGYAEQPADLALGDVHGNRLHTGDVGHLDDDGFLFVTGRTKRIGKIFGVRVSLDEVEQMLDADGPVAVVAGADKLLVYCEQPASGDQLDGRRRRLAHDLRLPLSSIRFSCMDALPKMANGKTDYQALERRKAGTGA
ncbi:AMP-binding protein [Pseudonocardia sp. TRM90224]|uniref:AMP-binding protein n=1 Tax=Pseudonocardia sp. TRM90224 TaxID=2812678 RepID=UPI001E5CB90F|nr:AMP-binding protein [Pseudonocardia sp. TRM90224]